MNFIYELPIRLNIPNIPFRSKAVAKPVIKPIRDGFITNPIYESFGTKEKIEACAKANPRIRELLGKFGLPIQVNIDALEKLKYNHLQDTRIIAAKIYSSLPENLKKEVSLSHLQEAALLHDYGKVLIPKSILDKKGKLNDVERKVMELHSELGYELLKDKGLSEKTLELIKYHHQNLKGTGYPVVANNVEYGLDTQILNVADKYSALREKRSYKNPLAKYEALEIIAKEVNSGEVSQDVYTALMRCV